ncbi:hypothetical protein ACFPA8_03760 [Streptomyces ovatisporus]|uniref:Integral membrane protein n=1 Tax=Streptomyces ovatisporus TaxID=1128682 RepID=A0ABV9A0Y9_9ACTN
MPDDVGGQPFPNGEEPEYRHHGAADDEFASVVFDEDFVRSAAVHEPTAAERILAAAQSHAESETVRGFEDGYGYAPGTESEFDLDADDLDEEADEDPDDEGRFDSSDYSEYVDLADGEDYGPYPPYGQYDSYSSYGPYSTFGDTAQFDNQFRQYNQFEQYSQFGIYRRYDPRLELGEEHGSDYRRPYGRSGKHSASSRTYRGHVRWQRPVAWVLAVVMGIGMVALALSAIYRGTSQQRQDPAPPPATSGVDSYMSEHGGPRTPQGAPNVSAQPRGG